jgi:glutathione synthase/RimK-type ligase-like ATP-grasp enzyme
MKIAIHRRTGSFSDRWIPYCEENNIPFKIVNCYDTDIITQLVDCVGLMWHWDLNDDKAALFAKQLTLSLEKKGIKVFPNTNTAWHYDDKVGQKYLLEAIDAPLVKSYVFYSKQDALKWLETTSFPKVFKLRNGASSSNVRLVKNKRKAKQLVNKAFGKGFPKISPIGRLKEGLYKLKLNKDLASLNLVIGGFARLLVPSETEKFSNKEKGYIYFQDFIPNNKFDTRVVVVGDRCYSYRRFVRKYDFRASGSSNYSFDPNLTDKKMIEIAFEVSANLEAQSMAYDFIYDNDVPKIVEISYCFCMGQNSLDECEGNYDRNCVWYDEEFKSQIYMIKNFLSSLSSEK